MSDEIKSCEKCGHYEDSGHGEKWYRCPKICQTKPKTVIEKIYRQAFAAVCRFYARKPEPTAFEEWWGAFHTMFDLSDPTFVAESSARWALAEVERWQDEVYKPNAPDLNTKLAELRKGL